MKNLLNRRANPRPPGIPHRTLFTDQTAFTNQAAFTDQAAA
jgi:hypothetical protein